MSAHWRTTARTHWPTLEAVAASPEALSMAPAQQHPDQPEQLTCTPVLTTTMLSAEWPHTRNNGETVLDNTEKDVHTAQERMPPHSENGFLPAQNITGRAPETLEDATAVFEATMDVVVKAVNSIRYNPMASLHRTATAHVHASRSRTGPNFADQRLVRSNSPRPLGTGPIRARHQCALGPSRESLHLDESRDDATEQLAGAPSRESGNPTEQQIPRPKGNLCKRRGVGLNIQEAMGLHADAESQKIYLDIVVSIKKPPDLFPTLTMDQHSARGLSKQAQIDSRQTWSMQEADRVAEFCRTMRNRHNILRKYENDWATKAILEQHVHSRRNYLKRRKEASRVGKGTATATTAGTDNGNNVIAEGNSCSDDGSEKDNPCPLETQLRRARRQNMPRPSRESLQLDDGIRPLDRTEQPVDAASKRSTDPVEQQIPRPKGYFIIKEGRLLKEAMGLDVDAASRKVYSRIQQSTRELAIQAQIDFSRTYSQQEDSERVAEFCRIMRDRHTFLRKYEKDWATRAMLQRHLNGRRHYINTTRPRVVASRLGRWTATATAAGTDTEGAVNAKDNASLDDDSETGDKEQSSFESDTEYDAWLGFSERWDAEI
ncbi:hypothetical protein FA95DRAFT_1640036 [Auriscalpium vulgare]|uniref:Uncharacterized protein n=1 Tax=Auriscalpium vulgare TaxID=40419 RepID=A0ACB8RC83_9AGAM|nr:hypothetical protein FA95DRAFT_1640036 [Auriscalpium vulgare]